MASSEHRGGVVVVHPGVQHSRELVRGLEKAGFLTRFITSHRGHRGDASWMPRRLRTALRSRMVQGVDPNKVSTIAWIEPVRLAASHFLGHRLGEKLSYASYRFFDLMAARQVLVGHPKIVVGFENSCSHIFRRAKKEGAFCVLDAASVHYSAQPVHAGGWDEHAVHDVNRRKEEEIGLADHIIVLSTYARETYLAAGIAADRISVIPPGFDFPAVASQSAVRSPTRYLYVGNVKYAKGVDLLLAAFSNLDAKSKALEIVGPITEPNALPRRLPQGVSYLGKLHKSAVSAAYSRADVLVLPSRADGFGFVVAEAMASGLPVIVSSAVGAKDLVTTDVTGWIFQSGDENQLRRAMSDADRRQGDLKAMGRQAREAVSELTWENYRERIATTYEKLLRNLGPD